MFANHWLVCDMDGTLTSTPTKAGGEYLALSKSPCYGPLRTYVANGGNLCVVSTAGRRMWRQIFNDMSDVLFSASSSNPRAVAGRLAICGFSGAAFFLSDAASKSMKEVVPYRTTALKYHSAALYGKVAEERAAGGGIATGHNAAVSNNHGCHHANAASPTSHPHHFTESTTIDEYNQEAVIGIAVDRVRAFINCAADQLLEAEAGNENSKSSTETSSSSSAIMIPPIVQILSDKYHGPYTDLAQQRNEHLRRAYAEAKSTEENGVGESGGGVSAQSLLSLAAEEKEALLAASFYKEVLTKERLMTHGSFISKTKDALVDLQTVPDTDPLVGIQVTVMGIPMRLYDEFFTTEIVEELASYGVSAKKQPNSVAINKKGIDKALCVQWMRDHVEGFSLEKALAFGDIPSSVDKPLTAFPPMQFISLSQTPQTDPTDTKGKMVFVGEEEVGAAAFLESMLKELLAHDGEKGDLLATSDVTTTLFTEENVARWAEIAKKSLAAAKL